jgi:hypothetical protein
MSEQDIITLFIDIDRKADYFLYMFITLNLGVIGALFYFDKPLKIAFKVVFLAIYLIFSYVIYASLISDLDQMIILQKDLQNILGANKSVLGIADYILKKEINTAKNLWTFLAVTMILVIAYGLFFPSLIIKK